MDLAGPLCRNQANMIALRRIARNRLLMRGFTWWQLRAHAACKTSRIATRSSHIGYYRRMTTPLWKRAGIRIAMPVLALTLKADPSSAQMPFYTDDPSVTPIKTLHIEIFDEYDGLQSSQFPDLRQNTENFKVNVSPWNGVELDLDFPYLTIQRAAGFGGSHGVGDTNLGAKWSFPAATPNSNDPIYAVSFYVEFPTGNAAQGLGSGLTDYWLNGVLQKPLSESTRINWNLGILFAGNTSTGAVGIQTRRGQVYTGGMSMLHDFSARLTLGAELYGGISDGAGQDKTQLQAMFGAQYAIRDGLTLCAGMLGGKYGGTPQFGGQIGIALDLPASGH
jgi:hypothetical protein